MTPDLETAVAKELAEFSREDWAELNERERQTYLREAEEIIAMVAEHQRNERNERKPTITKAA